MSAKHTPGPWRLCRVDTDLVLDGNYKAIAKASFRATSTMNLVHETKANARLIAAAPELLEALKTLTAYLGKTATHTSDLEAVWDAEKVIRKATGETK